MNTTNEAALESINPAELGAVTGGGIGQQIGSMFGDKGAKWGGLADNIMGMVGQATGGKGIGGILGQLGGLGGGSSGGSWGGAAASDAAPAQ